MLYMLIESMEKNLKQKKRVARVKSGFDDEIDGECRDYVSSIIKKMDSNFKTVQSNKLHISNPKITRITEHENVSDICGPSTSKTNPLVIRSLLRSKKFGLARKFPLMEKSQKILKQLKHNQSTPKQRAHLASFPKSSIEKYISYNNSKITMQTKINHEQYPAKMNSNGNFLFNKMYDNNYFNTNSKCSTSKVLKVPKKVNKRTVNKDLIESNSTNVVESVVNDDKSDTTTDSEYERFLQNIKKNLKRKPRSSSKVKTSSRPRKTTKQSRTRQKIKKLDNCYSGDDTSLFIYEQKEKLNISFDHKEKKSQNILSESENDLMNDTASSSTKKYKKRKKIKISFDHKKRQNSLLSESESGGMNEEIFSRNTSSDSDVAHNTPIIKIFGYSEFVEPTEIEHSSAQHDLNIENSMSDSLHENSDGIKSTTNESNTLCSTECFEQNNGFCDVSLEADKACHNIFEEAYDFPLLSLPEDVCAYANQNVIQPHREETDIEIVDIILPESKNTVIRSIKASKSNDFLTFITDDSSSGCCKELKIKEVTSLCSVKTKNELNSQTHLKVEDDVQEVKSDCNTGKTKNAIYITDMCKEFKNSNDNTLEQPDFNKNLSNVPNISKESISHSNNTVKKEEFGDDDDVIVVDCILKNKHPHTTTPSISFDKRTCIKTEVPIDVDNLSIKSETYVINKKDISNHAAPEIFDSKRNVTLKDFKLCDIAYSQLDYTKNTPTGMFHKLQASQEDNINIKDMLELFKKEFQIYQEIIQTEESVEKSLKTLESYQAEKLKNLRALIQNEVDKLGGDVHPKINEHVNLLCKTQKINKLGTSENKLKMFPEGLSKVIKEDIKDSSSQKISSISDIRSSLSEFSIMSNVPSQNTLLSEEKDVKPDLSETIKLLGEKCNICGKEAVAACQKCAKVFFCSNECGIKYWIDGHKNECGK